MTNSVESENSGTESFEQMGLKEELLRAVFKMGFENPSVIQSRAIKPCCEGKDVIAQAQSGTGKTLTFCVSVLQRVSEKEKHVQAVVLSPTRELVNQTVGIMRELGTPLGVRVISLIGGTNVRDDERQLREGGVQVIVGTPGRVVHLLTNNDLKTDRVKMFVIDEADEMLSEGFLPGVHTIFESLPKNVQVVFLSATMPAEMLEVTEKIMMNPVKILVKSEQLTLDGITQFYIMLEAADWKFDTLCDIYDSVSISKAVIFCSAKKRAEELKQRLVQEKFTVSCIHSDMSQQERNKVMKEFRSGSSRVLISTDLIARGIDVQQVSVVINYDLPDNKESYIHRIGRSGRYGRKGVAINFVTEEDFDKLKEIEQFYSTQIEEMPKDISKYIHCA